MNGWVSRGYSTLVKGENLLGHIFLLIIRLYWGALLVIGGFGKFAHIHGVADYFGSLHIPMPLFSAYLVGAIEILGGLSLFFGFLTRIFTVILTILFIVAYATAHHESFTNLFSTPSQFTKEDPFLYLFTTLVVLCFGPGIFSFDYWLEKRKYGRPL